MVDIRTLNTKTQLHSSINKNNAFYQELGHSPHL